MHRLRMVCTRGIFFHGARHELFTTLRLALTCLQHTLLVSHTWLFCVFWVYRTSFVCVALIGKQQQRYYNRNLLLLRWNITWSVLPLERKIWKAKARLHQERTCEWGGACSEVTCCSLHKVQICGCGQQRHPTLLLFQKHNVPLRLLTKSMKRKLPVVCVTLWCITPQSNGKAFMLVCILILVRVMPKLH